MNNLFNEIQQAEQRIRPYILTTPMYPSNYLSSMNGGQVYFKLESEQYTGSFKARGALNKVLATPAEEKAKGLITASTGNHALGFARALSITKDQGTIYLPENAIASKVEALGHYQVALKHYGSNSLETEVHARQIATDENKVWVSPYNDPLIVAGQGTIGVEITSQLEKVDYVLACVGGGGMISGVATWLKQQSPATKVIGCLPEHSPEMYLSVQKGEVVMLDEFKETLSDGSAGGLEEDSITFPICQQTVDDYILVSETEIAHAICWMVDKHHKIIEGAAAVAVASFLKHAERFKGSNVVIIICGCNIPTPLLKTLLDETAG